MELNSDVNYLFKLSRMKVRAYLLHNGSASQFFKQLKSLDGGILKKNNENKILMFKGLDPKSSDLTMTRLKKRDNFLEDRTHFCGKRMG